MGIRPVHYSITPRLVRKPRGMSRATIDRDQRELVERLALEAFNDCLAVGMSLQNAISTVFLCGMRLAVDIQSPLPEPPSHEGGA